jgi:hypothetical protein
MNIFTIAATFILAVQPALSTAAQLDFLETSTAKPCDVFLRMFNGQIEFNPLGANHYHVAPDENIVVQGGRLGRRAQLVSAGLNEIYNEYAKIAADHPNDPVFNEKTLAEIKAMDANPKFPAAYIVRKAGRSDRIDGIMRVAFAGKIGDVSKQLHPDNLEEYGELPIEIEHPHLKGKLAGVRVELGRLWTRPGPERARILYDLLLGAVDYLYYRVPTQHALFRNATIYAEGGAVQNRFYESLGLKTIHTLDGGRFISETKVGSLASNFLYRDKTRFTPGLFDPDALQNLANLPARVRDLHIPANVAAGYYHLYMDQPVEASKIAERIAKLEPTDPIVRRLDVEAKIWSLYNFKTRKGDIAAAKKILAAFVRDYPESLQKELGGLMRWPVEKEAGIFKPQLDTAEQTALLYQAVIALHEGDARLHKELLDKAVDLDPRYDLKYLATLAAEFVMTERDPRWRELLVRDHDHNPFVLANPYYYRVRAGIEDQAGNQSETERFYKLSQDYEKGFERQY